MVSASLGDADMYTDTGAIRSAVRLILKSMEEYKDHPRVFISFLEDEVEDGLYKASISITQSGSFPSHPLARDMGRLSEEDGGTFGTIRKKLEEYNAADFIAKKSSRQGIFLGEEKPLLAPLPATRFELAEWKVATVQFNYHIQIAKMHYSEAPDS